MTSESLSSQLESPVLFLVFNRLETTKQVFGEIRNARPKKLYVACDGPRDSRIEERLLVNSVRNFILESIDWPCELKTLFRDKNLGCGKSVSSAITWFFENEERGIILEDDCLPSTSFFYFCDQLLEKYQDDPKIMQINGSSFVDGLSDNPSYSFSKYSHIWGWATWRRAWNHYQFMRSDFETDFKKIRFDSWSEKRFWKSVFSSYFSGGIDTWDYPWTFTVFLESGVTIYPHKNMIENIGFGPDATHTTDLNSRLSKLKKYEIPRIQHPSGTGRALELDRQNFHLVFQPTLLVRVKNRLWKALRAVAERE